MHYFAYGSNLHWPQMQRRCPDARYICRALLDEHVLAFTRDSPARGCGVADAIWRRFGKLYGVLYEVFEADIATLDRLEGHLPGIDAYRRVVRQVRVIAPGAYLDLILAGARARDLPRRHIDRIAAFQTVEDLGGGAPKGLSRPE